MEQDSLIPDWYACVCAKSRQWRPTLCNSMDCRLPGSSVHGILQARILERGAIPSSSRGSSWPRDRTHISSISCIGRWVLYHCVPGKLRHTQVFPPFGFPSASGHHMLKQSSLLQAPVSPFRTFNIWLEDSCLEELVEQAGAWTSELDSYLSSATDFLCDFNFLICSLKKKKRQSSL